MLLILRRFFVLLLIVMIFVAGILLFVRRNPTHEYIAFISNRDGNPEVFMMNRDGSDLRQITFTEEPATHCHLNVNPDGLLYVSYGHSNLTYTYNVFGCGGHGPPRVQIFDSFGTSIDTPELIVYDPISWSPSGKHMVFQTVGDGYWLTPTIKISNSDGTDQQTFALPKARVLHRPSWSPDGQWIAYLDSQNIILAQPDGTVVKRWHFSRATLEPMPQLQPLWMPDSNWIIFHAHQGYFKLFKINIETNNFELVSDEIGSPPLSSWAYITSLNHVLVLCSWGGNHICSMDLDDRKMESIVKLATSDWDYFNLSFGLSADEKWIVYSTSDDHQQRANIYRMNLRTRETIQLTSGDYYDVMPVWGGVQSLPWHGKETLIITGLSLGIILVTDKMWRFARHP